MKKSLILSLLAIASLLSAEQSFAADKKKTKAKTNTKVEAPAIGWISIQEARELCSMTTEQGPQIPKINEKQIRDCIAETRKNNKNPYVKQ